jgi:hypothetical protein
MSGSLLKATAPMHVHSSNDDILDELYPMKVNIFIHKFSSTEKSQIIFSGCLSMEFEFLMPKIIIVNALHHV